MKEMGDVRLLGRKKGSRDAEGRKDKGSRGKVGAAPLQCWAHVSYKTSNPSDLADSVTMRTARGGYCEERGSEDMEERERQEKAKLAPATICYSGSPWHQEQPFSGKECASLPPRRAPKTRPSSRSFRARRSCRREFTRPASRVCSDGSRVSRTAPC